MREPIKNIVDTAGEIIIGRDVEFQMLLVSVLARGHVLIEDLPGMGKTSMVNLLSRLLGLELSRIQFTSDLLPSDVLGTPIFERESERFIFKKGPIFGELILADELNRASSKTQSALLQAMEEGEVSIEGEHYSLPTPFHVFATQNPLEQIGTNPLPESQLDRFMLSLKLSFLHRDQEKKVLLSGNVKERVARLSSLYSVSDVLAWQKNVEDVVVSDRILEYILGLLEKGREKLKAKNGLSPRAGKDLLMASKAYAWMLEDEGVLPEHVQTVAPYVFAHRLNRSIEEGIGFAEEFIKEVSI